ncbi:LysR family transcriptional regulator [Ferrimonas aestuarii]|uniref:LysR family transcriptional regulator n=2 Tax=Ferrimonas aestuarii TaxID=2569539 RepID=A0A4U1BTQ1_9GAMM|nr:LysR family transcriptional regulator [Ferrimonas aestuarii]
MKLFCSVVEKGSFAKAARSLGVTPAIVGRQIAKLEDELGFILLSRTTRSMQLTPGGKDYYQGAKRIVNEIAQLEDSLSSDHQQNPSGLIRLCAPDGLSHNLIQIIQAFRQQHPQIRFDLILDNGQTRLIEEEIDLSFRLSFDLQDSSMIATKLGTTSFGLYAAPEYLAAKGTPKQFQELDQHDCIHMGSGRYGDVWHLQVNGKVISNRQPWSLVVSSTDALLSTLKMGMGIGLVPSIFAEEAARSNALMPLSELASFPEVGIYALYSTRKHQPYRLTLFLAFVKQWFQKRMSPAASLPSSSRS